MQNPVRRILNHAGAGQLSFLPKYSSCEGMAVAQSFSSPWESCGNLGSKVSTYSKDLRGDPGWGWGGACLKRTRWFGRLSAETAQKRPQKQLRAMDLGVGGEGTEWPKSRALQNLARSSCILVSTSIQLRFQSKVTVKTQQQCKHAT